MQDFLRRFVVVPEIGRGGFGVEAFDFFQLVIDVKETP
ncbi:hypothetical protein J2S31_000515 [Nitrospina gracilis Nb-211]|nr:hypothetical protein [Nitrospina gracilis Nb-211]